MKSWHPPRGLAKGFKGTAVAFWLQAGILVSPAVPAQPPVEQGQVASQGGDFEAYSPAREFSSAQSPSWGAPGETGFQTQEGQGANRGQDSGERSGVGGSPGTPPQLAYPSTFQPDPPTVGLSLNGQPANYGSPYTPGTPAPYSAPFGGYAAPYGFGSPQRPAYFYGQLQNAVIPAGLVLPISLDTSISTQAARAGDYIQAHVNRNITLGGPNYLPAGTVVTGEVTEAHGGKWLERSGLLGIKFTRMRLPNGTLVPISGHLIGGIGKYSNHGNDTFRGEGLGTKLLNLGLRAGLAGGLGAALGTGVGAIAGGGRGVGSGAWSGLAVGAGAGALYSLVLRRGRDVIIHSGTPMQLQLDTPADLPPAGISGEPSSYR